MNTLSNIHWVNYISAFAFADQSLARLPSYAIHWRTKTTQLSDKLY